MQGMCEHVGNQWEMLPCDMVNAISEEQQRLSGDHSLL